MASVAVLNGHLQMPKRTLSDEDLDGLQKLEKWSESLHDAGVTLREVIAAPFVGPELKSELNKLLDFGNRCLVAGLAGSISLGRSSLSNKKINEFKNTQLTFDREKARQNWPLTLQKTANSVAQIIALDDNAFERLELVSRRTIPLIAGSQDGFDSSIKDSLSDLNDTLVTMLTASCEGHLKAATWQLSTCHKAMVDTGQQEWSKEVDEVLDLMAGSLSAFIQWKTDADGMKAAASTETEMVIAHWRDLCVDLHHLAGRIRETPDFELKSPVLEALQQLTLAVDKLTTILALAEANGAADSRHSEARVTRRIAEFSASWEEKGPTESVGATSKKKKKKKLTAAEKLKKAAATASAAAKDEALLQGAHARFQEAIKVRESDPSGAVSMARAHLLRAWDGGMPSSMREARRLERMAAETLSQGAESLRSRLSVIKQNSLTIQEMETHPVEKARALSRAHHLGAALQEEITALDAMQRLLSDGQWSSTAHRCAIYRNLPNRADRIAMEESGLLQGTEIEGRRIDPDNNLRVWQITLPDGTYGGEQHMHLFDSGIPWASHAKTEAEARLPGPDAWRGRTPPHLLQDDLRRLEALALRPPANTGLKDEWMARLLSTNAS